MADEFTKTTLSYAAAPKKPERTLLAGAARVLLVVFGIVATGVGLLHFALTLGSRAPYNFAFALVLLFGLSAFCLVVLIESRYRR